MFTGLVEEVAIVERIVNQNHSAHLRLSANLVLDDIHIGDSISVNGVCLTVVSFDSRGFVADAVPETMRRTNLGGLHSGSKVNLERALQVGARLGGHIVSGHVDGVGTLQRVDTEGIAKVLTIQADQELMHYIANKGSICVDGVSLTVMDAADSVFRVSIIPHTGTETTLLSVKPGAQFNLECDVLAKYVEKLLGGSNKQGIGPAGDAVSAQQGGSGALAEPRSSAKSPGIDADLLRRAGFL